MATTMHSMTAGRAAGTWEVGFRLNDDVVGSVFVTANGYRDAVRRVTKAGLTLGPQTFAEQID